MKIQSGQIYLRNMRFHARHGVLPQEHVVGGDYVVNLVIDYPLQDAACTDCVSDTLDYAAVYRLTRQVMDTPCQLIERVAYKLGQSLLETWPRIAALQVDVRKANPPMGADCDGAGVVLNLINDKTGCQL